MLYAKLTTFDRSIESERSIGKNFAVATYFCSSQREVKPMKVVLPHHYEPELAFIREILEDSSNAATRLVYADWLEEQGDIRAEFLRVDLKLSRLPKEDLDYQGLLNERTQLLAQIDETWVNLLAHAPIEKCAVNRRKQRRSSDQSQRFQGTSELNFALECPKRWEKLEPSTRDQKVRFCSECKKSVYFCHDIEEARAHAIEGRCVAVDVSVPRKLHDLDLVANQIIRMGRYIQDPTE